MTDTATPSVQGVDYEVITDSILQAASLQSAVAVRGTEIKIVHHYEYQQQHDDTIRMLLTVKVLAYRGLRYMWTKLGEHTFLAT